MRTEHEIREYRDALKVCVKLPCDCLNPVDRLRCAIGGVGIEDAIRTLSWVLGEIVMDDRVETMIAAASRHRHGGQ
jgi:hypothetical protein